MSTTIPANAPNLNELIPFCQQVETLTLTETSKKQLSKDFLARIQVPEFNVSFSTLSKKAVDLRQLQFTVVTAKHFATTWKYIKIAVSIVFVSAASFALYSLSKMDANTLSSPKMIKNTLATLVLSALAIYVYKNAQPFEEDEVAALKDLKQYLISTFPSLLGLMDTAKIADLEAKVKQDEITLRADVEINKSYFITNSDTIMGALSKEINQCENSNVEGIRKAVSELKTAQIELDSFLKRLYQIAIS